MTLDIDITDKKGREIIKIISMYPYGRLEIKIDKVFWCSDTIEPEIIDNRPRDRRDTLLKEPSAGDRFRRMSDALGSMVGPPGR